MSEIEELVDERGITRLCHFTPARNLHQMLRTGTGILAISKLNEDERRVFTPTDRLRLDGHPGHISCSIEYPNPYYFAKARAGEPVFPDWPVLFIKPAVMWTRNSLFCPSNAASNAPKRAGADGLKALFDAQVVGGAGRVWARPAKGPLWLPTDLQAEVLVPDGIALSEILGVAVKSEGQANSLCRALDQGGVPKDTIRALSFVVAPALFERDELARLLRSGTRPPEIPYTPPRVSDDVL